jgi:hypothetical protein
MERTAEHIPAAGELWHAGLTTPQRLRAASRPRMIAALGRGGYRRYDERTATQLRDMATLVVDRYGGDLRRLAATAGEDVDEAARLLQEVNGIGDRELPALVSPPDLARLSAGLVRISRLPGRQDPLGGDCVVR